MLTSLKFPSLSLPPYSYLKLTFQMIRQVKQMEFVGLRGVGVLLNFLLFSFVCLFVA